MTRWRTTGRRWPAFWVGLAVSVALHAAAVLFMVAGGPGIRLAPPSPEPPPVEPRWEDALRDVPIPPRAPPEEAEQPGGVVTPEDRDLPAAEPVPSGEAAPAEELAPDAGLSAAERLQPRIGDPRLWARVPIDSLAPDLRTRYDEAEAALRRLLKTYLDSLRLSEEQRRRARAWVFGEGDEKWGISPEGLHLGDVTIPLPFGQFLSRSGPARRRAEEVLRTWEMIQYQAGRLEAEEIREERLEAIRERTRERRGGPAEDGGADTASRDTTGA